jgi:hypothetical protein
VSRIFLGHSSANEAEAIAGTPAMMHQTAESIDTLVKNVGSYSPTCPGEKGIRVRACIELALDWPWIGPGLARGGRGETRRSRRKRARDYHPCSKTIGAIRRIGQASVMADASACRPALRPPRRCLAPIAQHAARGVLPEARVASALRCSAATGLVGSLRKSLDTDTDRRDSDRHGDAQAHDVEAAYRHVASPAPGRR